MKTRVLALLLTLAMLVSLVPAAFATEQGNADTTLKITHVSLDPSKDALGFKATVEGDLSTVTEMGFCFRVNGGAERTYTIQKTLTDGTFSIRVKNILAAGGGEANLEAYAFVVVNGETIQTEWQTTSMKQALQAVNNAWYTAGYSNTQKEAVKTLCYQYEEQTKLWSLENIFGSFFGNAGKFNTSSVIDLSTDCGQNPSLVMDAHKATPLYTYIKDLQTQNFSFEATVQVNSVIENEGYPKFGMLVNGETEMVKFYLDMTPAQQVSQVGAVHQNTGKNDDWAYAAVNSLYSPLDLKTETVDLKLVRDGVNYYFYVNGTMMLAGNDLTDENGVAGFFSFGTELTLTDYTVEANNSEYANALTQAKADAEAFNQQRNQILAESDSYTIETLELGGKVWNGRGYTFVEVPDALVGQSYVFGKIATRIDMTVVQSGYLYVMTPLTSHSNFPDNILAEGSGYTQVNIASDWCFANYNNPIDTLVFERKVNPGETLIIDPSWSVVVVSAQRINLNDLLIPNDGNTLKTVAIGEKIWTDEDKPYTFISMPQQLLGQSYIYGSINSGVDVTVGRNGYLYVVTAPRNDSHFAKDLDKYGFKRLEIPQWTFADYNSKIHTWVYELKVSAGERIQLGAWWGVLIGSETKLDLTGNGVTVAKDQLAVIESDSYDALPVELKQQIFSNEATYYYHTIPYWMAGMSYLRAPLNGATATVTKAGKLYLIGRNAANGQKYLDVGFSHVMDLDFEPWGGAGLGGGNFAAMGFALYEKDVTEGETVTWGRWGVPLFYCDKQLPHEPVAGITDIEITQMPTKTTYKLGESFDATGLVVSGIDAKGNKIVLESDEYLVAPSVLSADVPAVSVIVNDKICAIPVIVTDAEGKDLTDYTPADMSGFTTQKAPIVTGSISMGTVAEAVATIRKEEADGATGFIVYLTTLAESERTVENLKRIADCTEYPVMALAYGDYSNLEMRLDLWRMAVQAGFDAVDIPMDTFSVSYDACKTSYSKTIFAAAAPKEVSMDADVIAQQQAFMAELRQMNPDLEILMSAHVGVALNETQGVALAKEMENRGADFAKIVLASTANLEDTLQTNMTLQQELNVPFFYNCAGAASRPFRTAAGLMGTQVVFCCAPYHEINAYVYDYAKDLREFYNAIPELFVEVKDQPVEDTEGVSLTTDYFIEIDAGKYSLTTNSYTDTMVDAVAVDAEVIRAASYRVKATLSLTNANTWGQARILATADDQNGYVIALEKVGENAYQIFTMSRLNEGAWNDWRLIGHHEVNGSRNELDLEMVVDGGQITLLIDDKICYVSSRAVMSASTPGFGASNVATALVSDLDAQVFASSADAQAYLATKEEADYVSRFQSRIESLYNEYITEHGCTGKGGTLIFGDSYMDFWSTWESQTGLTKYENGYNVGIGGSAIRDWLLAYDQLVKPFGAERIIINIGYNDVNVWGDNGQEFAANLETLLKKIHTDNPNAEIYYIYINPSPSVYANGAYTNKKIEDAIKLSKELVASLDYVTGIDLFDLMTTADGKNPVASYYVSDNIHLSEEGYKVLSNYLYQLIFQQEPTGFFGNAGDYQTSNGVDFSNDQGENPSIRFFGASPQYTFINDLITDEFVFETQVNVSQVLNNDAWPKFGLLVNGASEMVKFYVDMKTDMTATQVGVVYQPTGSGDDWANAKAVEVPGMSFTGSDTIKLKLIRDGQAYYFYVNDVLVLRDNAGFKAETGAVGMFSFNTEFTASNYSVLTGDAAEAEISAVRTQFNFFTTAELDLSSDLGAHVGTVNVNSGKSEFLWVKNFEVKDFYFETKVHVNEIYNNDGYPKFGILVQDDATRESFYVDMTTNKTASKVGVMTSTMSEETWVDNWNDVKTETVEGMNFSGKGEYVTLGLKKVDGELYLYVNGKFALYLDSAITGEANIAVFGFNTGMELKEYFVTRAEGADSLLTLHTEGQLATMELGGKIWSDKTYTFYEMPEAFTGVSFIQNKMKSDISFTAKKDGYIYVITPYRGHGNSIADELDIDLYDRIETPAFYLAKYTKLVDHWIYQRFVKAGETITIPGNSNWHMVAVSELPVDPTVHNIGGYVFADHQLAIMEPTEASGGVLMAVDNGVYPFTDRGADASNPAKLQNLPQGLIGQNLIQDNLNDPVQATVTKGGKVFLISSTVETRKQYFIEEGYTFLVDLAAEYGNILSASSYNKNGYGLYVKDVQAGDYERTRKSYWSIPIFGSNEKLPAEPPVSIAISQMPTKTTYQLGESFDPTGMVVLGTDKYGNVAQLDASQYVTVPSTFTANAYAASVIVDDMIVAVPVTITDAEGNALVDDTQVDTTKYTTQKAPLLNGSVKRSTPDQVIAAIAKMEADGATAFNVHLTSLSSQYRNYESFKKIADCTDYPVMAIAYGDESNREYRVELMKEAVRAGFAIVDIPMNTFDADSRATLAGTVFESANPNEVSMNPDVIAQQKALIQEFHDMGAEVLMSAHIGVSLTEAEGVALAKEMEARGADVAKMVLGSSANSMQDVVMQTNQTLQNELNIKFYYNASGNASKPYRTASTLIGTHMVFCYAEYHESNLTTYDYISDLKAFYNTVPTLKVEEPMIKTNNGQKLDTVALGKIIWTTRDYVFTSMPEAFLGKTFVKASYGVAGETVDITVQKPGYIYVLTNAYKTDNSQAETLDEMNYTKLDMAGWKFCDFSGNSSYIWVYEKYVEPGETLQLGQWSVVIASEEKLNLDADCYKIADSDMAILQPAEGASVGNMEAGTLAFADRTYTISGMPYWLAGKNYIVGNYGAGSATATRGGVVYMITNTGSTKVDGVSMTRAAILEADGFTKVDVPAFTAISHSSFASNEFLLFKKTVAAGETVSWPSWAIPVFSGDLVLSENLAKIAPDGTTTQACKYEQNVRLFDNRTYYASGDQLEALHGKSFLYSGFDEGATGTVTEAGTVYVQIPVKNTNATYVALEEALIADGFTPVAYRSYRNNKGLPGKSLGYAQKLYQKEVAVGDVIHYGQYNLVYFDTLAAEDYYEMPSVTTAANIYNNPEVTGIQNSLYTYTPASRNWQGCPVVTITDGPNGNRLWAAWFTGGETELATGNMAVLLYSDDNGATWVDPAVAIVHPDTAAQVTKPQLWTMEDGRLWVSWSQHTGTGGFDGKMGTWAAICENPGAPTDELKWSAPQRLFDGRGNGKITVLNQGQANEEWLTTAFDWIDRNYSDVYSSTDKGATWTWKGRAEVTGSTYNNAIIVERNDGSLWMLLRQLEGNMKESFSYDGGKTWTNAQVSNIAHPNSAIYVGKTSSGKLLMINHKDFNGRNNLTAFLSEDGGKTWPYTLLLDARLGVSYPDVIEDNGTFYVVYDYDRFNTGRMYMAKITEADIKAGQLVSEGSYLKYCFASMGITGAQVSENAQKIDVSAMEMSASTNGSPASHAFDSDTDTRWCATSDAMPQWLMIDLKDVYDLEAVYIFFEQKSDWNFKIETSVDGNDWSVYSDPEAQALVDVTVSQQAQARYIRVTVESTTGGAWASIWEMEVYGNKL
ncbi:MAG: exo-alpha-sialidase [Oscillospiraceae bacterium]|nr:exo-alpha-sialidase [Oscillospiraceae bacterium]